MKTKDQILKSNLFASPALQRMAAQQNVSDHHFYYTKDQCERAMEQYGNQMYNKAIDDAINITYEQHLESGDLVNVIDTHDLLRLKK